MTVDDLIEENAKQRDEIKWLNDIIAKNISELRNIMTNNKDKIDTIETRMTLNDAKIEETKAELHENKDELDTKLKGVQSKVDDMETMPIGTIIAWVNKPYNDSEASESVDLPDGWMRCDGSTITHPSIWAGKQTPDLNGEKLFLRGGSDKEVYFMEEDQIQQHEHDDHGHNHTADSTSTADSHSHSYVDYTFNAKEHDCDMADGSYWCLRNNIITRKSDDTTVKVTTNTQVKDNK